MEPYKSAGRRTIGVVTEDKGAIPALPELFVQLRRLCGNAQILNPFFADVDPKCPVPRLCAGLAPRVKQPFARGASFVLVLLDLEDLDICPGARAIQIQNGLKQHVDGNVRVVLKRRCFENWLIADLDAIRSQVKLFPAAQRISYPPGQADEVDALQAVKDAAGRRSAYSKTYHPRRILAKASVETMAANSRSFSKFVRSLD
jgi:hypothetical protein